MHCSYQYSTAYTVKIHSIAKCTKMLRCVINLRPTDGIGYSEYCIVDACFMQGSTTAGTLALVFATQISGFFCRKLKDEERNIRRVMRAADRGDMPPPRKRVYCQLQQRVERLKAQYVAGDRSLQSYWCAVAHVVHRFD